MQELILQTVRMTDNDKHQCRYGFILVYFNRSNFYSKFAFFKKKS